MYNDNKGHKGTCKFHRKNTDSARVLSCSSNVVVEVNQPLHDQPLHDQPLHDNKFILTALILKTLTLTLSFHQCLNIHCKCFALCL